MSFQLLLVRHAQSENNVIQVDIEKRIADGLAFNDAHKVVL
jgi:broad specificity phosphatase PhoE